MITDSIAYIETFMDKILKEKSDDKVKVQVEFNLKVIMLGFWEMAENVGNDGNASERTTC